MNSITCQPTYNGFSVNVKPEKGCYTNILDRITAIFESALRRHSKVLLIRIDVSYPEGFAPQDNSVFQGFLENYIGYLQRKNFDPKYLWCSEVGSLNKRLHHHMFLLLNANEIQWMPDLRKAKELWSRALVIYPIIPKGCVKRRWPDDPEDDERPNISSNRRIFHRLLETKGIIHRDDTEALHEAIYWVSYLAKVYTKDVPEGVRTFGCSQL